MGDGVALPHMGEELVAEALALGGSRDEAGNVHKFHQARHHPFWLRDFGNAVEARIGHRHDAGVGLDGAEGEVLGIDAGLGQRIEEGGLADVRQSDDAAVEAHQRRPSFGGAFGRLRQPPARVDGVHGGVEVAIEKAAQCVVVDVGGLLDAIRSSLGIRTPVR